jgi:hypothetical protein
MTTKQIKKSYLRKLDKIRKGKFYPAKMVNGKLECPSFQVSDISKLKGMNTGSGIGTICKEHYERGKKEERKKMKNSQTKQGKNTFGKITSAVKSSEAKSSPDKLDSSCERVCDICGKKSKEWFICGNCNQEIKDEIKGNLIQDFKRFMKDYDLDWHKYKYAIYTIGRNDFNKWCKEKKK